MAETSSSPQNSAIDPRTGFCRQTKIFHSLRPAAPLPPSTVPHSITTYALSLLPSPPPSTAAFIDAATGRSLSFPDFLSQIQTLASSLQSTLHLSKGKVAFILSPPTLEIPVLYFALFSIGALVSPANPTSTAGEISHELDLCKPSIAFTTSSLAHKLPRHVTTVLLDSPHFQSLLSSPPPPTASPTKILQSDPAAILFSSGTTGKVKGVNLSHRNFIAITAAYFSARKHAGDAIPTPVVSLFTIPVFHVFGFLMLVRSVALGDTTVLMERFEFKKMLRAVEKYKVMFMPVSPPVILAMAKSDEVPKHDLSSLRIIGCGGAPLGKELAEKFQERFPNVEIIQGYGLTESGGGVVGTSGPENRVYGSVGRVAANVKAKVVDPTSGETLGPGQQGELWLSGPPIMKGYVGNDEATASTLTSDGWLKTGDLCYFDQDGFLFIVDRLKELIKYKAYQVPPAELELILQSHPDIADAAVIPYPDEEAGEIPMAIVVRQPRSTLSEEEVMNFVAKQVAPYKKIRRVLFTSSIPKSDAGKILRRILINQVLSNPTSKL